MARHEGAGPTMMVTHAAKSAASPTLPPPSPPGAHAGERMLADALAREARAPQGRLAVVARLSRLPPPGAQPHHRRIARALLEECAQRHQGQVFQLRGGDLVLLARPDTLAPHDAAVDTGTPQALPALLSRLLQSDGEAEQADGTGHEDELLAAAFPLAQGEQRMQRLLAPSAQPRRAQPALDDHSLDLMPLPGGLPTGWTTGEVAGLLQVQTAARLPDGDGVGVARIRPVHRALSVSPGLLGARLAPHGGALADANLRRHLAISLGAAVVDLLRGTWGGGGKLDASARPGVPPLHLRLPLPVLLSKAFAELAAQCRGGGATMCLAVEMAEACADPEGFAEMRGRLAGWGLAVALDGLGHQTLLLSRPEALGAGLLRLRWSGALGRLPAARRREVAAAVRRVGPGKIMLTGADSEAALQWGRAAGLHLFEGGHVDAMLAATRLLACAHAAACTLRQCAERAGAVQPLGRLGCANHALLDQAAPAAAQAAA